MTTRTKQLRAVVLAALMVLSVIAMGTAFVGTAAATNSISITASDTTVSDSNAAALGDIDVTQGERVDVVIDVEDSVNVDTDGDTLTFEFSGQLDLDSDSSIATPTGSIIEDAPDGVSLATAEKNGDNVELTFAGTGDGDLNYELVIEDVLVTSGTDSDDLAASATYSSSSGLDLDSDLGVNFLTISENGNADDRDGAILETTGDAHTDAIDSDTVFLGEEGLSFYNASDDDESTNISADQLFKDAGNDEGVPLGDPIDVEQPVGAYSAENDGSSAGENYVNVTLIEPRISTFEIQQGGNDVSGGTMLQEPAVGTNQEVIVTYNFAEAENITISVADETGLNVTSEFVTSGATQEPKSQLETDTVAFALDPSAVDPGEYSITVEGAGNIDDGEAIQTKTVTVADDESASLSLAESSVVQGNTVDFTITGVQEGSDVTVGIEQGDVTDSSSVTPQQLFRDVGDTDVRGGTDDVTSNDADANIGSDGATPDDIDGTQYYLAQLETDGGQAVGSVDTSFLDTGDVTLTVWPSAIGSSSPGADSDDDSVDLTVEEGSVSLDSPSGVYTIGSTVDISGTASEGIDAVALYARGSGDWELVDSGTTNNEITVDPDGTFEASDVNIAAGDKGGNDLLSVAGSYRLAIVDAEGADTDDSSGADDTLNSSAFADATTETGSIVTSDGSLAATFTTYNGQIAVGDDDLDVEGTATSNAGDGILLVLVDTRGNIESKEITVEDDGSFDSDITSFGNMTEGSVSAHVIAPGADGTYGDTGDDAAEFNDSDSGNLYDFTGTGAQVTSKILANTVDDTASDDQIVTQTFRYANARTSIDTVSSPVEADGTLTVEGQTNRDPDQADIIVELFDADDTSQALISVEEWDSDGAWSAELDLSGLPTGSYTVEADDTNSSDRADVEIVDEVTTPTPEPEPEPEPTEEPEPEPTEEPTEEETPAETPGFGLLVALTALVAAGFLALRRLD